MRPSKLLLPAIASMAVVGASASGAASSVPGEPGSSTPADAAAEARVAAALTSFDDVAIAADLVADGEVSPMNDPLGIGPDNAEEPMVDCFGDLTATVAEDGTFAGQVAGSESVTYSDIGEDDDAQFEHQVDAAAAVLDADAVPTFTELVDTLASDEIVDCVTDGVDQVVAESPVEDVSVTAVGEDVDVGDAGSMLVLTVSGSTNGEKNAASTAIGVAVAGDAVAVVTVLSRSEHAPTDIIIESLDAMITAMGT